MYLHGEPEAPFFDVAHAQAGLVKLFALRGTIRLGGEDHFVVE